jgi:alcohol dehydrogenase (cytochrome c)
VDQGGTVNPRDRFAGGGNRNPERLTGAIKAVDPVTGELKGQIRLDYPNFGGIMATAGNLIFAGHLDGTFSAYDAKTMQEVWSVNLGTGINAPPVTYSVNGKQYVAVLVGARNPVNMLQNMPELKNVSTASMLFVFGL